MTVERLDTTYWFVFFFKSQGKKNRSNTTKPKPPRNSISPPLPGRAGSESEMVNVEVNVTLNPLPDVWTEFKHDATGKSYYYNAETKGNLNDLLSFLFFVLVFCGSFFFICFHNL